MFDLLYADDTVLMSESPEELQRELNRFHKYCTTRKLKVNVEKKLKYYVSQVEDSRTIYISDMTIGT